MSEFEAPLILEHGAFDTNDPRSLISILKPEIAGLILQARAGKDHLGNPAAPLFEMGERDLRQTLMKTHCYKPSTQEHRLRVSFWLAYEQAQAEVRKIDTKTIVAGICTHQQLHSFLVKPEFVAFLVCPPADYTKALRTAATMAMDEMMLILEEPLHDPITKKFNSNLAYLKAKIWQLVDMRINGAYTQKIEQTSKNLNVNFSSSANDVNGHLQALSVEAIQERIKNLEQVNKMAKPAKTIEGEIIDE